MKICNTRHLNLQQDNLKMAQQGGKKRNQFHIQFDRMPYDTHVCATCVAVVGSRYENFTIEVDEKIELSVSTR